MAETETNTQRSQQIDAAIAEYLELVEQGTATDRDTFLAQHAEIADELRDFLGNYSVVKRHASEPAAVDQPSVEVKQAVVATCPNGHQLRIAARLAGRRAKCPKCEAPFVVPHLPATEKPKPSDKGASDAASTETLKFTRPDADDYSVAGGDPLRVKSGPLPERGQRFGQFEIVELIGEGGFGAVYRARNARLDRDVALKLPRPGMLGDAEEVARFLREAQAAAQLHHPNIVAVYDAGQIDGIYFIASAYIAGKTLKEELNDRRECAADDNPGHAKNGAQRFTPREIAALVAKLATALNYAHQKGIFHRDVKPENIMLDAAGEPHLMDFGLARRREGDTLRTREGIKMGTPAYMSPEQAKGASHLADARSDLWSLGVILFELLTGRLPFESKQLEVLLTDIIQHEPEPPRKLDAAIPRDLETICLKCLAKEPVRRYPSCQHLADELERWLDGEAITARPISVWERSWLWAKRRPAVAALSGILLAMLAAIVIVAPIEAVQQSFLKQEARRALAQKEEAATKLAQSVRDLNDLNATQTGTLAELNKSLGEQRKLKETAEKQNTELQETQKGLKDANARLSPQLATTLFEFAVSDYESGRYPAALARLGEAYSYAPVDHWLRTSARRLLVGWAAQAGQIDLRQGEPLAHDAAVNSTAFSPDGKLIVTGCQGGTVQLWNARTARALSQPLRHGAAVSYVVFSPDGQYWLSVGENKTLRWWSVAQQTAVVPPINLDSKIVAANFTSDSRYAMAATADEIRLWTIDSGQPYGNPINPGGKVLAASFSPAADAMVLATACADGTARFWDYQTAQPRSMPIKHTADVLALAFSPDGHLLLTIGKQSAQFWKVPKGEAAGEPIVAGGRIHDVAFREIGQAMLAAADDRTVQLWDVATCQPTGKPMLHPSAVVLTTLGADGATVLTRCADGSAMLWELPSCKPLCQLGPPHPGAPVTAFSPDGARVLLANSASELQIWRVPSLLPENPEFISAWVDSHSGCEVTESGTVEPLSAERLKAAKSRLSALRSAPRTP